MSERDFDVILWGASGFTGRLVAAHLLATYGVDGGLRWALAGRNEARLQEVRESLGTAAAGVPLVLADAADRASLVALARRGRVVCSTVGPYALHGSELVAACVAERTHYCDLTGEVPWMRRMIDAHHQTAAATGTRIVHTCGFDSIPSDLGTLWMVRETQRRHGACEAVKLRVKETRGGFSGGTVASMLNMLEEADADPDVRRLLADPYALNPPGCHGLDGPEATLPVYDRDFAAWTAPFVMAAINTRVVRRSNALSNYAYGREFRYDEGMLMPFGQWGFPLALGVGATTAAVGTAAAFSPVRRALAPLLPQPGQGPTPQARQAGYWTLALLGRCGTHRVRGRMHGVGDPGYASTSKMLGEAAVCLAQDPLDSPGGVLTPAVAMGDVLIDRLQANAHVTMTVEVDN